MCLFTCLNIMMMGSKGILPPLIHGFLRTLCSRNSLCEIGKSVRSFYTAVFWAEKSRRPFSDFLPGMPLCGRRIFRCKSSGQVATMCVMANRNLSMDVHSCHIRRIISLNHTQKFPAISFVKACMVCNQIDRSNSL